MKELLSYLRPYRKDVVLTAFCIEVETVFEPAILLVTAPTVDVGVVDADRRYILVRGPQVVVSTLISSVPGQGVAMFSARRGQGLGAEIYKTEFGELQQFLFVSTDHSHSSSLITRLTSDVTTIQNSVATDLHPGFHSPVMILAAIAASFHIDPKLVMVFLMVILVLGILLFLIISRVCPLYSVMRGVVDLVNRIIQGNLMAVRVVKPYVHGDYEIEKSEGVNTNLQTTTERASRPVVLNIPTIQFVMYSTILHILWFGGRLATIESVKAEELIDSLSYMLQVLDSLMMFSNVFLMITRTLALWRRISEVTEEEADIQEDCILDLKVGQGGVHFDHVYFEYHTDAAEHVLSDISFHISPGQTVGVTGQTGVAKSTLVRLTPRLYEVTEGTVYIDGYLVYEYPLKELRDSIAMVLQKNTLFSGTAKDNLRWGREDTTGREIENACHIACMDEFIDRLEHGYDTELGQGGANISGGQKQRLCITKTVLKLPRIMIPDDSTGAMDTTTEARIQEGLAGNMPGTTKITIVQRISSTSHADQITMPEDGTVNATSSHETFLAGNRIYQKIYYSQQEGTNL